MVPTPAVKRERLTSDPPLALQLLTIAEAADALRLSVRSVYRLLSSGELRPVRIGGRTFVTADELRVLVVRSLRHHLHDDLR
jgi:excisionase family DNA binding protein